MTIYELRDVVHALRRMKDEHDFTPQERVDLWGAQIAIQNMALREDLLPKRLNPQDEHQDAH